ncbi:TetR/AcrR family transcriptional regulator [Paenibacillus pinistramenti]|uniref:TetR/AcrR family transcriptional regulator n=1 Tax=Paenibacillus pinistramenti TaxID=1768003 RepID=UPI001107CA9E|nr:TetR/AcrR family transcriptional regulator [Paenibacillus pinistramenti]
MSDKSADKKQLIIRTALRLFSTKGARTTSMQDIADLCGISKGSLYLHFKSKEELEAAIYNYCFKKLEDQMQLAEHAPGLTPREKLQKQIVVLLSQVVELREYLKMQFMEYSDAGKLPDQHEHMRRNNLKLLLLLKGKMSEIYGPAVSPYLGDLLLLIHGMLSSCIQLLFLFTSLPFSLERVAGHLIELIDHTAGLYMNRGKDPLITPKALDWWIEKESSELPEAPRHPLQVIQELRQLPAGKQGGTQTADDTYESLSILGEEFLRPEPRKAILTGMLSNLGHLEGDESAQAGYRELKQLVQAAIERTGSG